jgi:hypothetical protein
MILLCRTSLQIPIAGRTKPELVRPKTSMLPAVQQSGGAQRLLRSKPFCQYKAGAAIRCVVKPVTRRRMNKEFDDGRRELGHPIIGFIAFHALYRRFGQ